VFAKYPPRAFCPYGGVLAINKFAQQQIITESLAEVLRRVQRAAIFPVKFGLPVFYLFRGVLFLFAPKIPRTSHEFEITRNDLCCQCSTAMSE
jgi:hypothetical protein